MWVVRVGGGVGGVREVRESNVESDVGSTSNVEDDENRRVGVCKVEGHVVRAGGRRAYACEGFDGVRAFGVVCLSGRVVVGRVL